MTETTNKTVMHKTESDPLVIAGEEFSSRLFLGTSTLIFAGTGWEN